MKTMMPHERTEYLRGIAASAPEIEINESLARQSILTAAFNQVKNPKDWKAPINAIVNVASTDTIGVGLYLDAIEYFTATKPELFLLDRVTLGGGQEVDKFRIVSEGYRLGPAGDH